MTAHTVAQQSTMDTMRRAIETRDAALLTSLYRDDVEVLVVDHLHPPSRPLQLHGKEAVAAFNADICGRAMTHNVEQEVVSDERIAFTEACAYPDGVRVLCATVLDLRDGLVARQTIVQTWDE